MTKNGAKFIRNHVRMHFDSGLSSILVILLVVFECRLEECAPRGGCEGVHLGRRERSSKWPTSFREETSHIHHAQKKRETDEKV